MVFITTLVNLVGLAGSLWLGFYILTRSPRSHVSWLAALTLWSLATFFLHNSLAVNVPDSALLPWFRYSVILSLPLWLHLSFELISTGAKPSKRLPSTMLQRAGILLCYVLAIVIIGLAINQPSLFLEAARAPRLFLSDSVTGPIYVLVPLFILFAVSVSVIVLGHGRRQAFSATLQEQFTIFLLATLIAGGGALFIVVGSSMNFDLPIFPGDALVAIGVIMLGYVVAKYNAMIEGRRVERDFPYTVIAVGSLTAFYVLVALVLYFNRQISFLTLILTMVGALSFNALYDGVRVALDRLFYRGQFEKLRANLRAFAREAGTGQRLNEQLQAILESVSHALRIEKGFVALREGVDFYVAASVDSVGVGQRFPAASLSASETIGLLRPERKGLVGMELLVPLFGGGSQIGAIVLGSKENREPYSEQDLEFLDDLVDIAGVIHSTRMQAENIQTINAMVEQYRERERALQLRLEQMLGDQRRAVEERLVGAEDEIVGQVEDVFRHLHDLMLSEHPLSRFRVVEMECQKQKESSGSMARGKALHHVMLRALDHLKPDGKEPSRQEIPAREWHPFIILRDSYVNDEPNRNIMARLYIGEGTFNRTRRRALRSVAQALQEMEREAQRA
jgi:hypothetical protein